MKREVELSCRCGGVHGVVTEVAPASINRIVCYCADRQAFLHQLRRAEGTKVPFLGIAQQAFATGALGGADAVFGPPRFLVYGKHAVSSPPKGSTKLNPMLFVRVLGAMLGWALRGVSGPNPYSERETGKPKYPVLTLSSAERESLRPLCGPRAA